MAALFVAISSLLKKLRELIRSSWLGLKDIHIELKKRGVLLGHGSIPDSQFRQAIVQRFENLCEFC